MSLEISPHKHLSPAPNLGLGLGLRNTHFDYILENTPEIDWFEAISENFMDSGGRPQYIISQLAERYPIVLHGVSLSIGSIDALDFNYLKKLKKLATQINTPWVSDHLCWTGIHHMNSHDLLPLPLNEETLKHVSDRILTVQDYLERPLVLENPSTYLSFEASAFSEPEFFEALVNNTQCKLLLDVNNVYVSSFNNDLDPIDYLQKFPMDAVVQMHLAGHTFCGTHIIDTHDQPVRREVWELYRLAYQLTGGVSTLLEWDGNIPSFDQCLFEINKAKEYMSGTFNPNLIQTNREISQESLSTPIDFLMPDVMNDMRTDSNR